jgi:hypothetical protein
MKKLLIAVFILIGFTATSLAQTSPAPKKAVKSTTHTAKAAADTAKVGASTVNKKGVKKDGTADMRYKANKDSANAVKAVHLKKDGTPDKRYKPNKKAK